MSPIEVQPLKTEYPSILDSLHSKIPRIVVNKVFDASKPTDGFRYLLS